MQIVKKMQGKVFKSELINYKCENELAKSRLECKEICSNWAFKEGCFLKPLMHDNG